MGGRTPGPMGTQSNTPGIDLGTKAPTATPRPGTFGGGGSTSTPSAVPAGTHDPAQLLFQLRQAMRWADVSPLAVRLLGQQSFGIGAVYGMGAQIVNDVVGLAELAKIFILADLYDLSHRRQGWSSTANFGMTALSGPLGLARALGANGAAWLFKDELREAAVQRDELIEALRYMFSHPKEMFENVKQEYVDKWRAFEQHSKEQNLSGQFAAGRIFGELLLEVLALFATGAGLIKLATKIPKFANIATRLGKIAQSLPANVVRQIQQGGRVATGGPRKSASAPITPSQLLQQQQAKQSATAGAAPTQKSVSASPPSKPAQTATPEPKPVEASKVPAKTPLEQQLDDMYKKAPAAKSEIDAIADEIAKQTAGSVAKAPLKGRARAMEKALEYQKRGGDAMDVKDLARNTIVVDQSQYDKAVALLKEQGAKVKSISAASDPLGYSGTNSVLKTKSGISAEIQVNTPDMIYAKEKPEVAKAILGEAKYAELAEKTGVPGGKGHELYEQFRTLPDGDPRAPALAAESRAYYDHVRLTGSQ